MSLISYCLNSVNSINRFKIIIYSLAINIIFIQLLGNIISISILSVITGFFALGTIATCLRSDGKKIDWVVIISSSVWFVFPFFYQYPHGFDPYGHLFLIDRILENNFLITDWMPLEAIPLNYPTGMHGLLACYTKMTGIHSYMIFKWFFALCGFLTSNLIYLFYRKDFGQSVARYASFFYTFLTFYGSLHYLTWGGLPNALAMVFFLLSVDSLQRKKRNYFIILFTAIFYTHHNTIFLACLFYFLFLSYLLLKKNKDIEKTKIISLTFLLASPLLLSLIFKIDYFKFTGMDLHREPLLNYERLFNNYSWAFWPLVAVGIILKCRKRISIPDEVKFISLTLLVLFILFEYVGRFLTKKFVGQEIAYMAPSRFLTNMSYFFCLYGGIALATAEQKLSPKKWVFISSLGLLVASNYYQFKKIMWEELDSNYINAYNWIKLNTSNNSRIIASHAYSSYFSNRVSTSTLIPSSEFWKQMNNYQKLMIDMRSPTNSSAPIFLVTEKELTLSKMAQFGEVKIYQFKI